MGGEADASLRIDGNKWAISIAKINPRFHMSNYVFIRGVSYPWDEYSRVRTRLYSPGG